MEKMDIIPERALVIAAHADDIEFGCSGTVAKWTAAGAHVTYVLVTDGSSGSNEPGVKRFDLIATREAEQRRSADLVGVADVRFLGHMDGHITPTLDLRRDLTRIIREVQPQIVISMDPLMIISEQRNYINHPDHRAVGEAAMYAVFPSAGSRPIFKELLVEGFEPHNVEMLWLMLTNEATHKVDISDVIDTKRASLHVHESQLNDDVIEMVINWNKEAGEDEPFDYAEQFRVIDFRQPPTEKKVPPTEGYTQDDQNKI